MALFVQHICSSQDSYSKDSRAKSLSRPHLELNLYKNYSPLEHPLVIIHKINTNTQ